MSTSFDLPYRGLPVEIRLRIWSLTIPHRPTVLRDAFVGIKDEDPNGNRLLLFPSLQIQLLRVNKQVYSEVLSGLQKVQIHLRPSMNWDYMWPKLARAMQAPAFGSLDYSWYRKYGDIMWEFFLPKLLTQGRPCALKSLNVSMLRFDASEVTAISKPRRGYWTIKDHVALPVLIAAVLQQGAIEIISITIEMIRSTDLHLWSEDSLRGCMTAHPHHLINDHPRESHTFRQFISEYGDAIEVSNIKITVEFFETSERGIYSGKVEFTKVLNGSKKACLDF